MDVKGVQSPVKCTWRACRTMWIARVGRAEPCKSREQGVQSHGFQSLKLWFAAFSFSFMIKLYDKIHVTLYRRHKVSMWCQRNTVGISLLSLEMVSVAWQTLMLIWRNKKVNGTSILLNSPKDISAYQNALISLIRSVNLAARCLA